jgi:hypothetical protein
MTASESQFSSLDELRKQSDLLVEAPSKDSSDGGAPSVTLKLESVNDFIRKAAATGRILDSPSDRREAQSLIDYWIARVHAIPRRGQIREMRSHLEGAVLEPFDSEIVESAITDSGIVLGSLDKEQVKLARRILLGLMKLPANDAAAQCVAVQRSDLHQLGSPDQIDNIVRKFSASGAVAVRRSSGEKLDATSTPAPDDRIAIKYESLIRKWRWLEELVAERKNFREMAELWQRSNRSDEALIGVGLTRQFRSFGDLNQLEQDFVARSNKISVRWQLLVFGSLALALLSFISTFAWEPIYRKFFVTESRIEKTIRALLAGGSTSRQKVRNIEWLVRYTDSIRIPTVDLYAVELNDLNGPNVVNFTTATLDHVKFERAKLVGSSFRKGKLFDVRFENADLRNVGFDDTVLSNVSFKGADLVRATFDGATLCGEIDFSEADLRSVSFRNITYASSQLPKLERTAWWLIDGLSFEERNGLSAIAPYKRGVILPGLAKALQDAQVLTRRFEESDKFAQASQLNERAWSLAIYGADQAGDAAGDMDGVKLARQSIAISEQQIQKGDVRDYAGILNEANDTLGYLLLQRAAQGVPGGEAQELLKEAADRLAKASKQDKLGGVTFRYAVALIALRRENEAVPLLDLSLNKKEYGPTHELLFLDSLLTKEMKDKVGDFTNALPRRRPPRFVGKEREASVCQPPPRTEGPRRRDVSN